MEGLQTEEQRRVLNIVAQLRKCGLESILSLPQLVVCGDQSAGKSSVLEALTEIPFPRNDNLCTRFATEIILRRATTDSLTIKVIPDTERPGLEQESIRTFQESITNFSDLPRVMKMAMGAMGLDSLDSTSITASKARAFARDVLSIEIEGPSRPQLTLVDLPGLIQSHSKGVTEADVEMVKEITDHYISQPRTICLAVIAATNDYANQGILTKVRRVDPQGERTLGIITKPDKLSAGSGSEKAFLELARNQDILFSLGWHVLKNRAYEEGASSLLERNISEATWFRSSNFKTLPRDCLGIDSLRVRLSQLLFEHIKQELPRLREDLEKGLADTKSQIEIMGDCRATPQECKTYLMQLSLDYRDICKAAVGGSYEGEYFEHNTDQTFSVESPTAVRRLRAVIQKMNTEFSDTLRTKGYKYHLKFAEGSENTEGSAEAAAADIPENGTSPSGPKPHEPKKLSHPESLHWVREALTRNRGKELTGNFNPLLIGELFWEQSSKWHRFAVNHLEGVARQCSRFVKQLLEQKCPTDVHSRLWSYMIHDALKSRSEGAVAELDRIMEDIKGYPINYNHYYTDTIKKRRQARGRKFLAERIKTATTHTQIYGSDHKSASIDVDQIVGTNPERIDPDMEKHTCEEALDCLFSIYKVNPPPLPIL